MDLRLVVLGSLIIAYLVGYVIYPFDDQVLNDAFWHIVYNYPGHVTVWGLMDLMLFVMGIYMICYGLGLSIEIRR